MNVEYKCFNCLCECTQIINEEDVNKVDSFSGYDDVRDCEFNFEPIRIINEVKK